VPDRETTVTANDYPAGKHDDGERVWIEVDPRRLEADGGRVVLSGKELLKLLCLAWDVPFESTCTMTPEEKRAMMARFPGRFRVG
jgi:hypothetical protein